MTAATANAGIMFTNLFRIRLICHELGYVKILDNVPQMFSFGNSNIGFSYAQESYGPDLSILACD